MEFGRRYTVTTIVFDVPFPSNPREYPHIPYIFRNYNHVIGLHFAADNTGLSSLNFFWWVHKFCLFLQQWRFSRSRSSKVIGVGTNRKRICDFLLVRNSNLGPILHRFRDFARFLCSWPHPYSTLILGVFPLHQIAYVGVSVSRDLKLFGREIIFEVFYAVWKTCLNVTDRQTDKRTDDMQSHNRALRSIALLRGVTRSRILHKNLVQVHLYKILELVAPVRLSPAFLIDGRLIWNDLYRPMWRPPTRCLCCQQQKTHLLSKSFVCYFLCTN